MLLDPHPQQTIDNFSIAFDLLKLSEKFPIINISSEAPEESEAMGTKEKFWFHHEQLGLCLYKKARQNTGEDWSEKIAAELCKYLSKINFTSYYCLISL